MFDHLLGWYTVYTFSGVLGFLPRNGILPSAKFTLRPSLALSYIGSVTARHSSSRRQLNFAALSTGGPRDLCVGANFSHIFKIPDPDLPIHYITFWCYDKDKWSYLPKQCMALC